MPRDLAQGVLQILEKAGALLDYFAEDHDHIHQHIDPPGIVCIYLVDLGCDLVELAQKEHLADENLVQELVLCTLLILFVNTWHLLPFKTITAAVEPDELLVQHLEHIMGVLVSILAAHDLQEVGIEQQVLRQWVLQYTLEHFHG